MGIRARLVFIMGLFSLIATLVIGGASYKLTERNALAEAREKGLLLLNYMSSYREYFRDHQRALVMEIVSDNRFYPELMSGFVVTRGIWDIFKESQDGYFFKQATVDPLYPANKADGSEMEMINIFRQQTELTDMEGVIDKNGERFFYMAFPVKVDDKRCLRCHGDPLDAPKDQIEIYGTENGYHWQLGDTVSAFVVYVSIEKPLLAAKRSAGLLFLIGIGSLLLAVLLMTYFLDRRIVRPIEYLSDRTAEIGRGENLGESLAVSGRDEIGVLARAIEHLRLSMIKRRRD